MATWKEQREYIEEECGKRARLAGPIHTDCLTVAIRAALARLDAAERALAATRGPTPQGVTDDLCDAYDALVREQDGGKP